MPTDRYILTSIGISYTYNVLCTIMRTSKRLPLVLMNRSNWTNSARSAISSWFYNVNSLVVHNQQSRSDWSDWTNNFYCARVCTLCTHPFFSSRLEGSVLFWQFVIMSRANVLRCAVNTGITGVCKCFHYRCA